MSSTALVLIDRGVPAAGLKTIPWFGPQVPLNTMPLFGLHVRFEGAVEFALVGVDLIEPTH